MSSRMKKESKRRMSDYYCRNCEDAPKNCEEDKNESVNVALKKLAKTYSSTTNPNKVRPKPMPKEKPYHTPASNRFAENLIQNGLKSKSNLSDGFIKARVRRVSPSSPAVPNKYSCGHPKEPPFRNIYTMTQPVSDGDESENGKKLTKNKSLEKLIDRIFIEKPSHLKVDQSRNYIWKDRRLAEKYSLLKVPWKRSNTLPICASEPTFTLAEEFCNKIRVQSDKKTYLYDDGTEADSTSYLAPRRKHHYQFSQTFQSQMLALLNVSAYICALLVLSLIVWFVSGNKLHKLLIPKQPENPLKKCIKFIGGGIIYTISSIVGLIGSVFAIPTQQVYQPPPEWPPL